MTRPVHYDTSPSTPFNQVALDAHRMVNSADGPDFILINYKGHQIRVDRGEKVENIVNKWQTILTDVIPFECLKDLVDHCQNVYHNPPKGIQADLSINRLLMIQRQIKKVQNQPVEQVVVLLADTILSCLSEPARKDILGMFCPKCFKRDETRQFICCKDE